jgi:Flp pilus assembly protein TadG
MKEKDKNRPPAARRKRSTTARARAAGRGGRPVTEEAGRGAMEDRKGQVGYVAVSVALAIVVLCGFAALAVDINILLAARSATQRAADSGALAGAFTFVTQP